MTGDDERDERPRLSWSELDKRRDKPRSRSVERKPRGAAAEARARGATQSYLKKLDERLFAEGTKSDSTGGALAASLRAALGTPELDDACRRYLDELGPPKDPSLVAAFLDARDRLLQLTALAALAEEVAASRCALTSGLRSQLRILAAGPDDELAERAEDLLAAP